MISHVDREYAARLLRRIREGLGLNRDELSRFLGVTRETIARWERAAAGRPDQITRTVLQACVVAIDLGEEIELRRAMEDPVWLSRLHRVFVLAWSVERGGAKARAEENSSKVEESLLATLPPLRIVRGSSNGFAQADASDEERDQDGSDDYDEGPH